MTIGAIIQARMSSRRLPGKVLLPVAGKPMLQHVIDAVEKVPSLTGVIVATSGETSDDLIADYCLAHGISLFRGSLENVAERFWLALRGQGWQAAVRVSADSPLLDWHLVEKAVTMFASGKWDVVTNVFPRLYPKGQSVEVVSKQAYQKAYKNFSQPEEFEHVMPYFYTHASDWRIGKIISPVDQSNISVSIDTAEDLARIQALMIAHAQA